MDTTPAKATPAKTRKSSYQTKLAVGPSPDIASRAVIQLNVRVSAEVDEHLTSIMRATGRTKRELVELAIKALDTE